MSYLIKYADIRSVKDESNQQFNTTCEKVEDMKTSITNILNCEGFKGQSAACVKNYLNEVHALLLAGISTCILTFSQKLVLYCDGYYQYDSSQDAVLPEEVLTFRITEYGKCIDDLQKAEALIGGHFSEVSDIFSIANPSMTPAVNDVMQIKSTIETLHNNIVQYETANKSLTDLEDLINSLKTSISEYKDKTSVAGVYQPGDIKNSSNMSTLVGKMINAINKSQEDAEAVKIASDHQHEISVNIAAEQRKTQGFWNTISGVGLCVGGVLCIVFTAGAATPIVVGGAVAGGGTILFGSCESISGVQDYVYGSAGDIQSQTLKQWVIEKPFQGNETAYNVTKEIFSFSSGVFTGLGSASTLGTLTFRSGSVIVGKEVINEGVSHSSDLFADKVGMSAGDKFFFNLFTTTVAGKGLDGLDTRFNISGTPPAPDLANHEDHGPTPEQQANLDHLSELGQAEIDAKVITGELPKCDRTHLDYMPSSGVEIVATPGKTTTVLGRFATDTDRIINGELEMPKSTDFSGKPGGLNLLNVPDDLYMATPSRPALSSQQFWDQYNKPFLDAAIERNDVIAMATRPEASQLINPSTRQLTGFGREYYYLQSKGYTYNAVTSVMEKVGN